MNITIIVAAFIFGSVFGYAARTILFRRHDNQNDTRATEEVKLEFSQYKQEVADQFVLHHQQLLQLTEHINRLNKHWNETALTLNTDGEAKILPTLAADVLAYDASALNNESIILPSPNAAKDSQAA